MSVQVVAHQVQHRSDEMAVRVNLGESAIARVDCNFGRGQGENQPAATGVDERELQHVANESPVRVRVRAVYQEMRARDHEAESSRDSPLYYKVLAVGPEAV